MKTILYSTLAFGAWASLACAEPLPPPNSADDITARSVGPVALTEAEMDKVTAGAADVKGLLTAIRDLVPGSATEIGTVVGDYLPSPGKKH